MAGITIYTDGAARGNPGPSASGFTVYRNVKRIMGEFEYNGENTNNHAEYTAIVMALEWCSKNIEGAESIEIELYSDSELVVRQLNGQYKVKADKLKALNRRAAALAKKFGSVRFRNLPRSNRFISDVDGELNRLLDSIS